MYKTDSHRCTFFSEKYNKTERSLKIFHNFSQPVYTACKRRLQPRIYYTTFDIFLSSVQSLRLSKYITFSNSIAKKSIAILFETLIKIQKTINIVLAKVIQQHRKKFFFTDAKKKNSFITARSSHIPKKKIHPAQVPLTAHVCPLFLASLFLSRRGRVFRCEITAEPRTKSCIYIRPS